MDKNVGGRDRQLRLVGAVVLAVAGAASVLGVFPGLGTLAGAVLLVGSAGLAFNVVTQRCLVNRLFGVDTCGRPDAE